MKENLSSSEIARYAQQIKLAEIGVEGQLKLKNARVLCVGAGGLGSSLLSYLAAAGVGTLGIIDDDLIELSNLQRQILYKTQHLGLKKATQAKQRLMELNPEINIHAYPEKLTVGNAASLIEQYDIVADCSDNFSTRYLINDFCFSLAKPFVSASIDQFSGQCAFFSGAKEGPCYRCLFPEPPAGTIPDCTEGGVLGVLPGLLGVLQATEILKWILEAKYSLTEKLLVIDILKLSFRQFGFQKNPECEVCVAKKAPSELQAIHTCSLQQDSYDAWSISPVELKKALSQNSNLLLIDVRTFEEHRENNLGGLIIPLAELPYRLNELDLNKEIVLYCRSGKRSIEAAKILINANYAGFKFLAGGILAWSGE